MLDLREVIDNLDGVAVELQRRGPQYAALVSALTSPSAKRLQTISALEALRSERNRVSEHLANVDKKSTEFTEARERMKAAGEQIKTLEQTQRELESELEGLLLVIPNLPDATTPNGKDESANPVLRTWGEKPVFDFTPKDHVTLGTELGILDMERGAKISGSRFAVLWRGGARLERALINFMLDLHTSEHGYTEVWPPALVKDSAMRGTGQLPKFAADAFKIASGWQDTEAGKTSYDLYLAPTAEVPVTNLHAEEILDGESLPRAYTAYSPCFRSEAGSYGRDMKGMIRMHQFDKVELVRLTRAEDGFDQLEILTKQAEAVLQKLGLHYRVIELCTGDLGFSAKKTYDIEVWLPGQNAYREISSCSWFGDFQARRANIRYRPAPGEKPRFVHTLNGSAMALSRTMVAIWEQYQTAEGGVRIPEVLWPYMGGIQSI